MAFLSSKAKDHGYLLGPTSDAGTGLYQDDDGSATNSTEKEFASKVRDSRLALCVGAALGLTITSLEFKVASYSDWDNPDLPFAF